MKKAVVPLPVSGGSGWRGLVVPLPDRAWWLAGSWGCLVMALSVPAWSMLGVWAGEAWRVWVASPDFSWRMLGKALAGHFAGALVPISLVVASFGAGRPLALLFRTNDTFIRLALGWGIIGLIVQGLGYPGLYFRPLLGILAFILVAGGIYCLIIEKPWGEFAGVQWRNSLPQLAVLGVALIAAYLMGRMPDTGEDARTYHLAAPENYLLIHRIVAEPNHFGWHMPFGAEMSFLVPYGLGGLWWAKQVNVAVLFTILGLTWRLSHGLGRGSLWAPLWVGTAGLIMGQCWEVKNDLMLGMYVAGAVLCAVRRRLTCSAWLMGLAIGIKFTAGLSVAGLVAGLYFSGALKPGWPRLARLGVAGLLPFLGWLVESGYFLGNPFHPFLSGIFPDLSWAPFYQDMLYQFAKIISPPGTLSAWDYLLGIWRGFGGFTNGSMGLIWILPLALLGRNSREARIPVICIMTAYLLWLPSYRNARYLFPLIPLVAALASDGRTASGYLSGWGSRRLRGVIGVYAMVVALVAGFSLVSPGVHLFMLGQKGREELLRDRYTTWEEAREWVNAAVPPGRRVLLSGEERRLWLERRVSSNGPIFEPTFWKLTRESFSPAEIRKRVKQAGWSYMMNNFVSGQYRRLRWFPGPDWSARQLTLYRDFVSRYFVHVWRSSRVDNDNGGFLAVMFAPSPLKRPSPVFFLPGAEGLFYSARVALEAPGGMEKAMADSARALALMPGVRDAEYLRGAILIGRPELAEEVSRLVEPGIREGFVTSNNIGVAARAAFYTGRMKDARKLFVAQAMIHQDFGGREGLAFVLLNHAQDRMARKDFLSAWHDAEAGGNLLPGDARFRFTAATVLAALGRHSEASRFLAEGRRLAGFGNIPGGSGVGPGAAPRSMINK